MTGRLTHGVMWDVKTSAYLKKRPGRPFPLFLSGWAALMWGDAAAAGQFFDAAIELDSGYTPAHIGKICCEVSGGHYRKAAVAISRNAAILKLSQKMCLFRLNAAISQCAMQRFKDGAWDGGNANNSGAMATDMPASNKRGLLKRLRYFAADKTRRGLWVSDPSETGRALLQCLKLVRYIELRSRDAHGFVVGGQIQLPGAETASIFAGTETAFSSAAGAASASSASSTAASAAAVAVSAAAVAAAAGIPDSEIAERRALAIELCDTPGLPDEFKLAVAADAQQDAAGLEYLFDSPVIFPKALLNGLFREKITVGKLREPRIILSNLRRDAAERGIENVNKWMFLKLSHTLRRDGGIEKRTAQELAHDGWWADPVVRAFLGN